MVSGKGLKKFIFAFTALFCIGAAYALTSADLHVSGFALINMVADVKMEIVLDSSTAIVDQKPTGEFVTQTSNTAMTYALTLDHPGQSREIKFKIKNTGNVPARVIDVLSTIPLTGIAITVPQLINEYVEPNGIYPSGPQQFCLLTVTWGPTVFDGVQTFATTTTLQFSQ